MNKSLVTLLAIAIFSSCEQGQEKLFKIRYGYEIGVDFQNTITTNDTLNALSFEYIYNGSGVGVGDFNNDGLEDLFFGGNQVSSKLYLNQGELQFRDVTAEAGVTTDRWVTGVAVVDINQDGLLDVHLAVAGITTPDKMRDLLFINQGVKGGIPQFKEMAREYGIDDDGYGTMGAFFDYDRDGDLDLYLLTNALEKFNRNNLRPKRVNGEASSTDRLYRNNGDNTFTNVSREAGILIEGYGLGVNITDLNDDNWPDVYVSNDFMSNDLIWINQQDGTFRNAASEYLKHQTHNGMGVDISDFNNDALPDIAVVDMLPPDHKRQKMMTPGQNYDHFHMSEEMGYQAQYMRNTLQLNRGKVDAENVRFSEIAFMSGVSSTDWSWAPLFADFDNDGWKDLFIANGYRKDVTDLDFIFFGLKDENPFGTPEARAKRLNKDISKLPDVKLNNYVFRNNGSLIFEDKTKDWGTDIPTFSNGAAYADLDNDGDQDLVVNNIDQEVLLYENLSNRTAEHYYVKVSCKDAGSYQQKVWVFAGGVTQYQELTPYRGFQSSVSTTLHFGLGGNAKIDSIKVLWPDLSAVVFHNIDADTTITFSKADAVRRSSPENHIPNTGVQFTKSHAVQFRHRETSPSDIKVTRTLLHEISHAGPCIASGDVNNDGLDDFFVGGERRVASKLFIQTNDGQFRATLLEKDSLYEDGDAHFFDFDNDNDLDLYVGSSCASSQEEAGPHRLYVNDGRGNFMPSSLPDIRIPTACIVSADYDADGDLDLFIGGRIKPKEYPHSPKSIVLRNDNGEFTDVTESINPALSSAGMITSAVCADLDNDKRPDLIVAGEWMPVRVFLNKGDEFEEATERFGLGKTHGWWNCLKVADLNGDGFVDIVAGNTGKNSYFQPTVDHPVTVYAKDFDANGSVDPIITYYNNVEKDRFMVHNRMVIIDQIPAIKRRFEKFIQYATTPFDKALTVEELEGAFVGHAYTLSSTMFINNNGTSFTARELPEISQLSTLNDFIVEDINYDGHADIVGVGNNYWQETLFGRYDASFGVVLLGDSKLGWRSLEPRYTGFIAEKNARHIRILSMPGDKKGFVVANNNDSLQLFILQPNFNLISKK